MIALLLFAPAYALGCYALYRQAVNSPIRSHEEGYPITAKIIPFPAKGKASPFHSVRRTAKGSNLVAPADFNPSRGGN